MITGLSRLFEPFEVKGLRLNNRFVLPAMQRGGGDNGAPTPQVIAGYRNIAEGGCALIFSESTAVDHPSSTGQKFALQLNERTKDAWRRCVDEVRSAGSHLFIQLWHEGGHRKELDTGPGAGTPTVSPSGLVTATTGYGKPATIGQLQAVRDGFIRSAVMAKEIGASGVEVHSAHGYFLDQMLWSVTNVRDDEYGGPELRNRMRLPLEIVRGIRAAVGPDFPISFRFSQFKEVDYAARICETPDQLRFFVEELRAAGVDIFDVSTRRFSDPAWPDGPLSLAGWVKSFTDAVVIATGSVGLDRDVMTMLFKEGETKADIVGGLQELVRRFDAREFDLIAIGRSQLGDAQWVRKVREGRFGEIRHFTRSDIVPDIEWDLDLTQEAQLSIPVDS